MEEQTKQPLVGIIMGSKSDFKIMKPAAEALKKFGIPYEVKVVSAHRTPDLMAVYATTALDRGLKVIIAGAGGAAHLPGMVSAYTILPVLGVPVKSSNSIDGWDSILSILQMPGGVPVGTLALDAAMNAGIMAAQIIGTFDESVRANLLLHKAELKEKVSAMNVELDQELGISN
jgi:5-(carboxyamino)imidazole ribonucleotide mutase